MPTCPSCRTQISEQSRYCGGCGAALPASGAPDDPTVLPQGQGAVATILHTPASRYASAADDSLFTPGSIIAGRYRIIACLGKGGMGEVYRADDLTLGQPVALKFLPEALGMSQQWMERFRNEVRTARQVAHPNVCRVHDLADTPGPRGVGSLTFLTMEYIDGEDLASLLRRIGRLPRDKAVQVAHQLCAGVAAAHNAGVLHRDLKPANIMLDGRGNAKITDFGIAGLAGKIEGGDVRSGTPAYMSPEQLAGREVTTRSDIYSLGLVLYELFTGQRAFKADTVTSATASRTASQLTRPSTFAADIDPAVERVIMRCLADDPAQRPASALAIAAALPGGDPLRAALDAGETPSPELVAAAGSDDVFPMRFALPLLALCVLSVVGSMVVSRWTSLVRYLPLPRSPEVLADRAREVINTLAPGLTFADSADSLSFSFSDYAKLRREPGAADRLHETGRPAIVRFWYRASPRDMIPFNWQRHVWPTDPPNDTPGMASVELDMRGRLIAFEAVPPWPKGDAETVAENAAETEKDASAPPPAPPFDWSKAFTLAGLDIASLSPVDPKRLPPHFSDQRFAWSSPDASTDAGPSSESAGLHVEAASYEGRPTSFRVMHPSDVVERAAQRRVEPGWYVRQFLQALSITVILAAAWLARRNYLTGSGDRSGAARLAIGFAILSLVQWALGTHLVGDLQQMWRSLQQGVARAMLIAGIAWISYMALEPFVRRRFPELMVSWTRLLSGRLRDPLVGRDALLGFAAGALFAFAFRALPIAHEAIKGSDLPPIDFDVDVLSGVLGASRSMINIVIQTSISAMVIFFFYAITRLLRTFHLGEIFFAIGASYLAVHDPPGTSLLLAVVVGLITGVVLTIGLRAVGLFAYIVALFAANIVLIAPPIIDADSWAFRGHAATLLALAALLAWAFTSATGFGAAPKTRP